jgi:hypothetical protein
MDSQRLPAQERSTYLNQSPSEPPVEVPWQKARVEGQLLQETAWMCEKAQGIDIWQDGTGRAGPRAKGYPISEAHHHILLLLLLLLILLLLLLLSLLLLFPFISLLIDP